MKQEHSKKKELLNIKNVKAKTKHSIEEAEYKAKETNIKRQ